MLTRRSFTVLATGVLAAPAIHPALGRPRTLRLGLALPLDSHAGVAASVFATELAQGTEGRFRVEVIGNSAIGGEDELAQGVAFSTAHCAMVSVSALGGLDPYVSVLDLPFLFRDRAHAFAVVDGPIGMAFSAKMLAKEIYVLGWGEGGVRHLTANREVRGAAQLGGLKLGVQPSDIMLDSFRTMGASADKLAWNQVHDALRTGRLEAEENPIGGIIAGRFHEVQKYLMLTAHTHGLMPIIASAEVMEDLEPEDEDAFMAAGQKAAAASRHEAERRAVSGLAALRQKGMVVIDQVDRDSFVAAMAPILPVLEQRYGAQTIKGIRGL